MINQKKMASMLLLVLVLALGLAILFFSILNTRIVASGF